MERERDIVKEENVYLQYKNDVIDFVKKWDFNWKTICKYLKIGEYWIF